MMNPVISARNGKKYFKTIHGNWIKVLYIGLSSIRIAYLDHPGKGIERTAIPTIEFQNIIP